MGELTKGYVFGSFAPCHSMGGSLSIALCRIYSIRLERRYEKFRKDLQNRLAPPITTKEPVDVDEEDVAMEQPAQEWINAALEALETERENRKALAAATDEAGGKISAIPVQEGPDTVDDALEMLLHNATEEFGFAPRASYS